jgi:hypothetical protein
MPLLETIALSLGAAIAKAILKSWGLQTDLANAPVDLLKAQIEKALTGRDTGHEIEKIGAQIAARMRPLFEHEGAKFTEDERALVAQEVAQTLAQSNTSAGLLIEHNLNPQRLARHLIGQRPNATRPLSAMQAALYERTLTEAARAITQIADQLSGFDRVRAAAQLATPGLDGPMPRTLSAFLAAGYALFDNALNTKRIQTRLAEYGYTAARLKSEREKIAAYDAANQAQEAAIHTRSNRRLARDERVAGANHQNRARGAAQSKQLLEKIGVAARPMGGTQRRSSPTAC